MKCTLIILFTLLSCSFINAQKGEWSLRSGLKMSYKGGDKPTYLIRDIDVGFVVENVEPLFVNSYSLVYSRQVSTNFYLSLGLSKDIKGYRESGKIYDATNVVLPIAPFKMNRKINYLGFLTGVKYKLGKIVSLENLVNGQFETTGYENHRKFAFSNVFITHFDIKLTNKYSALLSPFFETALQRYDKPFDGFRVKYLPFGYGLMVGLKM
jgi:hypothetical protein